MDLFFEDGWGGGRGVEGLDTDTDIQRVNKN